jgi:hypothetical protein
MPMAPLAPFRCNSLGRRYTRDQITTRTHQEDMTLAMKITLSPSSTDD